MGPEWVFAALDTESVPLERNYPAWYAMEKGRYRRRKSVSSFVWRFLNFEVYRISSVLVFFLLSNAHVIIQLHELSTRWDSSMEEESGIVSKANSSTSGCKTGVSEKTFPASCTPVTSRTTEATDPALQGPEVCNSSLYRTS